MYWVETVVVIFIIIGVPIIISAYLEGGFIIDRLIDTFKGGLWLLLIALIGMIIIGVIGTILPGIFDSSPTNYRDYSPNG